MLASIKAKLLDTDEKKRLASNIFSLGVLQGANYLLPLLTVPYLVRILGPEYFGLLAFANATIAYFVLITDYGFNLSATRQISIHRGDKKKINEIFGAVMIIKTALMIVSFLLLSLLVFSVEKFNQHWEVYFVTFGMVVGQVIFPVWLFQGMERMKYISYLNISAKIFFTACIFIFVHEKSDYLLVPLLTSAGFIVAGIISIFLARKEFGVNFHLQPWSIMRAQIVDGWYVFVSTISISFYTISATFILGLFSGNIVVGYFAAADKIIRAVKGIYQPVSQSIYPLMSKKIEEDQREGLLFAWKVTIVLAFGMLVISFAIFLSAETIVNLLLGSQYHESIILLKIMAFLPTIVVLSNMFGVQIMLNIGQKRAFMRILVAAAFTGIVLSFLLVPTYNDLGTAVTLLMVEVFVTIAMLSYLIIWARSKC